MRRRFNWIYIGLALLLLVAVCFLWDMHVNKKEITGTFSTGKDLCGSGLYISFFPRGEYLIIGKTRISKMAAIVVWI